MCELESPIKALSAELTKCNTVKSAVYCEKWHFYMLNSKSRLEAAHE